MSVEEYDSSYNVLMHDYEKEVVYQTAKPIPAKPKEGPLGPWYQGLAEGLLGLSTATRGTVQRLDLIRPPPERLDVHRATRVFFDLLATDLDEWAATTRTGNKKKIDEQIDSQWDRERPVLEHYLAEAKRVGYVVPEALQHWPPGPQ
ncbi:MAG: hypothetical protein M9921_11660 [Fimbriimonadaceae bacterium]|nr:hypothetical protein [Fimbriimonadaceae bacterium]